MACMTLPRSFFCGRPQPSSRLRLRTNSSPANLRPLADANSMSAASQNETPVTALIESDADLIESARTGPGQIDNRAHPRYSFRGRSQAVVFSPPGGPDSDPKEYEVITTDVCRGGLSLFHRAQLYPGQQI